MSRLYLADEAATERLGQRIAVSVPRPAVVMLRGVPGAGKTTLARGVIAALCGADVEVTSPGWPLLCIYEAPGCDIWHIDLYRLDDSAEIAALDLACGFAGALCLLEWPERLPAHLWPARACEIHLVPRDMAREATIRWHGDWSAGGHAPSVSCVGGTGDGGSR